MLIIASIACLLWGAAATYCFFNAWLAVIGMLACVIGWVQRRIALSTFARLFFEQLTGALGHGLGLALVFALGWYRYQLGRRKPEILLFLLAALSVMAYLLPQIPQRIERIWQATNPSDTEPPE